MNHLFSKQNIYNVVKINKVNQHNYYCINNIA